ncbi:MAG: hypothetical protein FJX57_17355, partial [Alphaproteobacteria bacterium]|nr:hypothetical protein [Alphaproteobacteria bacterium]
MSWPRSRAAPCATSWPNLPQLVHDRHGAQDPTSTTTEQMRRNAMTTQRRTVLKGAAASLSALAAPSIGRTQVPANTIIFADDSNSDVTYDPRVTQSRHEEQVIVQIFDQLIMSDENGKLSPGLATAWQLAPDAMSIHLKLREGVKFHDGTAFSAEAVKFTLDTIVDPKT